MQLDAYSMGIGDRFGRQGKAQLSAFIAARKRGQRITPVWNKSFREHSIIGTTHRQVREEADRAVAALGWNDAYRVDADHISLKTVAQMDFIAASDFFTLDVADFTNAPAPAVDIDAFVGRHERMAGTLHIEGIETPLTITRDTIRSAASRYLLAVREAGRLYRHIAREKGADSFITEISMDETDTPQTPVELLFILAAIADEGIPAQTIAPRFSGRFNKGVEYVGDVARFAAEFEQDVCVIAYAIRQFGLPAGLKLSVHSGSDKFAIYPAMHTTLSTHNAGVHLKTAGTTWLEEIIGLAAAGGSGLALARRIYRTAYGRIDELCAPYASVIDIDRTLLAPPADVDGWDGGAFTAALKHDRHCRAFNPHMRQLLHVGFKVAAELGDDYRTALDEHEETIARQVSANLFERHMLPLFFGDTACIP